MDLTTVAELTVARGRADLAWRPGDAFLAGGTWLFSEPQPGLRRLLDLTGLGWTALQADDGGLRIAATCTLAELARVGGRPGWPALALFPQCCHALVGSFKVWNAATVGGNICLALPAAPVVALAAALDGVALVWTPDGGERRTAVADLVTGAGQTSLAPGEVLREVTLPAAALRCRTAFRQESLSPAGRSAALVIGRLSPDDGSVVLSVTASTVRPVLLRFGDLPDASQVRDALAAAGPVWQDDVHGHPAWREHLTDVLLQEVRTDLAAAA